MATITLRLSAKTDKSTSKHEILMRFRHGSIDQYAKTNVFIIDEYWNDASPDKPVVIPRFRLMNEEQKQLIAELTGIDERLKDIQKFVQQSFIEAGAGKQSVPSDWLKMTLDTFNGIADDQPAVEQKQQSFFEIFDKFLEDRKFSEQRVKHYKVLERMLKRYELYNKTELTLDNITGETLRDFEQYFYHEHELFKAGKLTKVYKAVPESREPQPRGENSLCDLMKRFRAFFRWANGLSKSERLTDNNPFNNYEMPDEIYGTPYYITIDERKQLYNATLPEPLATQRDIFVFQCYIGCRVSDLWNMTRNNIIGDFVEYIPRKTKEGNPVTARVPLTATAKEILDRYKDFNGKGLFPFTSQQEYNRNIKEMFKQAGLNRVVTVLNPTNREEEKRPLYEVASSHMARRAFIGNLYKKVQDPNLIVGMSGHKEGSKAFARYRQIDDDMNRQTVSLLD